MTYKHSHFGIYGLIYNSDRSALLLIRKTRGPYNGMLDLPGGSPEEGESEEQTLIREIQEETGADLRSYHKLRKLNFLYNYTQNNGEKAELTHKAVIFEAQLENDIQNEIQSSDSAGCFWYELKQPSQEILSPLVKEAL